MKKKKFYTWFWYWWEMNISENMCKIQNNYGVDADCSLSFFFSTTTFRLWQLSLIPRNPLHCCSVISLGRPGCLCPHGFGSALLWILDKDPESRYSPEAERCVVRGKQWKIMTSSGHRVAQVSIIQMRPDVFVCKIKMLNDYNLRNNQLLQIHYTGRQMSRWTAERRQSCVTAVPVQRPSLLCFVRDMVHCTRTRILNKGDKTTILTVNFTITTVTKSSGWIFKGASLGKMRRPCMTVHFLCVIRCFHGAPVARGRIQMCVFFFTVRRVRRGASEPITSARGAGRVWTVVVMENGQFNTQVYHSYPDGKSCAITLNRLAGAWPWCEEENHQRGHRNLVRASSVSGRSRSAAGIVL